MTNRTDRRPQSSFGASAALQAVFEKWTGVRAIHHGQGAAQDGCPSQAGYKAATGSSTLPCFAWFRGRKAAFFRPRAAGAARYVEF
jgi:hypothetical protein